MAPATGTPDRIRVVVVSPSAALGAFLVAHLPTSGYEVVAVTPGPGALDATQLYPPGIAVVDRVDERPQAAATEIAVLKGRFPGVQVIAVSERSTPADAGVLEQGVFFYLAARPNSDLVRVIEAAGRRESRSSGAVS